MTASRQVLALLLVATLPAVSLAESFDLQILRDDRATRDDGALTLSPDPEVHRVVAPAMALIGLKEALPQGSDVVLEIEGEATAPAALELQAIYNGRTPALMPRRVFPAGEGRARWAIPQSDRFTSMTLSLRGEGAFSITRMQLRDSESLSIHDLLRATYPEPLHAEKVLSPVEDGSIFLRLYVPRDLKGGVYASRFEFVIGERARQGTVPLLAEPVRADLPYFRFEFRVPEGMTGEVPITLMMETAGVKEEISTTVVDLRPLPFPAMEVPARSIESFSAIERNGELAVYTSATSEGVPPGSLSIPDPTAEFFLHVGNGEEWVVTEELSLVGQGKDWLGSAPLSFTIGRIDNRFLGFFTSVFLGGYEGLSVATADGSLRLFPSAKNPVWIPDGPESDPALWRGNAFFDLNGAMMLVGLEKRPGKAAQARALTSTLTTRWVDLGVLPLPGLREDAIELTSIVHESRHLLLAGPTPQLFVSEESPLRDWREITLKAPPGWSHRQIVQWNGGLWLFGIVRHGGRGVVAWAPVDVDGDVYTVREEFEFTPPPLPSQGRAPVSPQRNLPNAQ